MQGAADGLDGFSEAARESHVLAEAYDLWVQVSFDTVVGLF